MVRNGKKIKMMKNYQPPWKEKRWKRVRSESRTADETRLDRVRVRGERPSLITAASPGSFPRQTKPSPLQTYSSNLSSSTPSPHSNLRPLVSITGYITSGARKSPSAPAPYSVGCCGTGREGGTQRWLCGKQDPPAIRGRGDAAGDHISRTDISRKTKYNRGSRAGKLPPV